MKKRFLLILAAIAAVATTTVAAEMNGRGMAANAARLRGLESVSYVKDNISGKKYVYREDAAFERRLRKAAEDNETMTPIENPEGEKKLYKRESLSFWTTYGEQTYGLTEYSPTIFSFADDDVVYIQNPISNNNVGGWVKATRNGDLLEIKCPQMLVQWEEEDWFWGGTTTYSYYISVLSEQYDEELEGYTFKPVPEEEQVFRLIIDEDGFFASEDPNLMLGVTAFRDMWGQVPIGTEGGEFEWLGNGDVMQVIDPFDYELLTPPAEFTPSEYALIYDESMNGSHTRMVKAGAYDNKFYVQGLYEDLPEGWICGEIDGDEVYFPVQYLGLKESSWLFAFLNGVRTSDEPDEYGYYDWILTDGVTLNYDAEKQLLTLPYSDETERGIMINSNPSNENIWYLTLYYSPILKSQEVVTSYTPMAPYDLYGWAYEEGVIDGRIGFTISNYTEDYIILESENLYYQVLIDGEEMTIDVNGVQTSEIPMDFESEEIYGYYNNRMFNISKPFDKFAVRTIYKHDGKTYYSDFAELSFTPSGVAAVVDSETVDVRFFDLSGREVRNPGKGSLLIRKTVKADGTSEYSKVVF